MRRRASFGPRAFRGSAKAVLIWLVVAATVGGVMAARMLADGVKDVGFIVAVAVAAVIALAIVAPRRFESLDGASPTWEEKWDSARNKDDSVADDEERRL